MQGLPLAVRIELQRVAEARSHTAIRCGCYPEKIHFSLSLARLPFLLGKLQTIRPNLHRQVDAGYVYRRHDGRDVEIRKLHRCADVARLRAGRTALQILSRKSTGQKILRLRFAVIGASAHIGSAAIHFDVERVASTFFREFFGGFVSAGV